MTFLIKDFNQKTVSVFARRFGEDLICDKLVIANHVHQLRCEVDSGLRGPDDIQRLRPARGGNSHAIYARSAVSFEFPVIDIAQRDLDQVGELLAKCFSIPDSEDVDAKILEYFEAAVKECVYSR